MELICSICDQVSNMWFYTFLVMCFSVSSTIANNARDRREDRIATYYGGACTTPNNEPGNCTTLESCEFLRQLLLTDGQNSTTANFLRKSQCGHQLSVNRKPVVCCSRRNTVSTPNSITGLRPSKEATATLNFSECGKTNFLKSNIIGGRDRQIGEWPWMVALGYRSTSRPTLDFKCGGTLISDKWVVTAAHCVQNLGNFRLTTARLGDTDLNATITDDSTPVDETIDKIIPHPEYSSNPVTNDIALLRLNNSVKFSVYIRHVCLPSGSEYRSDRFYYRKKPFVVGWGAADRPSTSSTRLHENTMRIVNTTDCANTYSEKKHTKIDHRVLCADEKGRDSCTGDMGVSLFIPNLVDRSYYLHGILSSGFRCADGLNFPLVFTRIAEFTDWIGQTTGLKI